MTPRDRLGAPIRVVIVADVRLYREGLSSTLRGYPCLNIVGTAATRVDATLSLPDLRPDVVIIDTAMPESIDLIRDLRLQMPATDLIAFAVDERIATIVECAEAGATSYVNLDASIEELVKTIELSTAGELVCPPRVAAELFRSLERRSASRGSGHHVATLLTSRENEVLALIRQGLSNKEIASALNIAETTVKNHVHHLLEKLHVGSRAQAAVSDTLPPGRRRSSSVPSELRTRQAG
jgi:DNA-binding NarL/FixJ family response regulator